MQRLVRAPVTCCARAPVSHSSCPSLSSFFLKSCGLGLSSCGVGHGRHIAAFKSPIKVEDKPAEEAEANPDFAPIVSTDSLALLGLSLLLEDGHRQCRGRPCIASTIYTHTHTHLPATVCRGWFTAAPCWDSEDETGCQNRSSSCKPRLLGCSFRPGQPFHSTFGGAQGAPGHLRSTRRVDRPSISCLLICQIK